MSEKQLSRDAVSPKPEIRIPHKPYSNQFMGVKDYADYFSGKAEGRFSQGETSAGNTRRGQIEAVAQELNTNPGASFEFSLSAGESERSRDFEAMMYGLQGYSAALAEAAFTQGYNLRVVVDMRGRKSEFGRMGMMERIDRGTQMSEKKYQVYGRLPDDPAKPTKYLLIQVKQHPTAITRRYTGDGALVGYVMEARLVESNPIETQK